MEKFNLNKKIDEAVGKSKRFIKNAVIAGSIFMSAEQGMAQQLPNDTGRYEPTATWKFEEGTENKFANNPSIKYPGFF